ncbi:MAG: DUF134 domain-containing protein [Vulcanibacillus sp.]
MSRPRKQKRVCGLPQFYLYGPLSQKEHFSQQINMTIEEYESIRLIDLEDLDQEDCAEIMGVARSTVQRLYNDGKKKLAESLVNGKVLKIDGGDYVLCNLVGNECSPCLGRGHRFQNGRKGRYNN